MRRRGQAVALAVLLPAALAAVGCFQGQRTIRVRADGSGTIVDTLVMNEQMQALAAASGKDKDPEAVQKEKAKNEAAAVAMGPGVSFVGEEKTAAGITTRFAFKDVNQVKVGVSPGPDSEGGGKEQPLTFRLARKSDRSVLTIVQPQPPPVAKAEGPAAGPAGEGLEGMGRAMWPMMKPMMKGLRIKTVVEVDGALHKTNSPYQAGNTITLFEMDFDQVVADEANFKKFTAAGDDPSTLDPKRLQGVKGIKVSPAAELTIEFAGK